MISSSMIVLGLSWWQAWICVWIGYGVVAPFIVLNARPGAMRHITFPVVARTSFGLWGSLWCTFNRGVMACIWYGVQASIGGSCVLVCLRSMWPSVNNIRECSTLRMGPAIILWPTSEPPPGLSGHCFQGPYVLLSILVDIPPCYLVPYP